ncbi:MAG: hypothetical protein Kow0089_02920 [Desulfobulbaceae bacterium]
MDPSTLIPVPDTLPVPWGWFKLLLLLTLFMHIILMNVMLGTAFIALVNHCRGSAPNPLTRDISRKLPMAIAFTVNFGVAPLLFVQVLYGHFLYTSSVLMANYWLLVIGLLITGYYMAYIYNYRYDALGGSGLPVIGYAVFALLAIGFFMSNNFTMMMEPETWVRYFEHPTGLLLNLGDPTLFPRYLHFMTAAVAVGGLSLALFYEFRLRRGDEEASSLVRTGCNWFGYATIVNFGLGFWFYGTLPPAVRSTSHTAGLLIGLLLIVVVVLGAFSIVYSLRGRVMGTLYTALPTVFVMILVRDLVRTAYLRPYFSVSDLEVVPQYSPFFLFLVFFAGGLYLVYWMFRLAWRSLDGKEVRS